MHQAGELDRVLNPNDTVIYHLSIGSPVAVQFARVRARRVLYFQNISPPESADPGNAIVAHYLRWGMADLALLAPIVDLAIAPSTFNADVLRRSGSQRIAVIPIPLDLARLRPRRSIPRSPLTMLFVGRFAPHKRQEELIRMLAAMRGTRCPDACLVLASGASVPGYVAALRRFAADLDVGDAVEIHETSLSDHAIGNLYAEASVFVCSSDHEGFCVPLLEAMAFSVPVLAYAAAAVPETVGSAGILVPHRDPLVWAELAFRLATDDSLRARLNSAARERLLALDQEAIAAQLDAALAA
ncbi:MAG: glycosyltransferase family 4 protein [Chloroflexi bacterium]|nr:MAG: glycosyltransferase family 4 protein [Chloroflexota bacterium]